MKALEWTFDLVLNCNCFYKIVLRYKMLRTKSVSNFFLYPIQKAQILRVEE